MIELPDDFRDLLIALSDSKAHWAATRWLFTGIPEDLADVRALETVAKNRR